MQEEKRSGRRYPTKIDVIKKNCDGYNVDYISNISCGGAFLESNYLQPVNSKVKILVDHINETVPIEGKVVWRKEESDVKGMGVRFTDLSERGKAVRDDLLLSLMYESHCDSAL